MIINKTPHEITLVDSQGNVLNSWAKCPQEELIRLAVATVPSTPILGVPTSRTIFGEPTGLPEFAEDVYYIVSQMVKAALPQRTDMLVPAEVLRSPEGKILGCQSLGR